MKRFFLALFIVLFAASSCKRTPDGQMVDEVGQLSFSTNVIAPQNGECELSADDDQIQVATSTQVAISPIFNEFTDGDEIGLYIVEWEGAVGATQTQGRLAKSGNQTDNQKCTYVENLPNNSYWSIDELANPLTWRKVSYYAYNSYQDTLKDPFAIPFNLVADQSTSNDPSRYLMWGVGDANATGYLPATDPTPAVLNFKYKTALVEFTFNFPATFKGVTIASIDEVVLFDVPVNNNKLNLETGVLTVSTDTADRQTVKMYHSGAAVPQSVVFSAIVTPHTIAHNKEIAKVTYNLGTADEGEFYLYASDPKGFVFAEGNNYVIRLKATEFTFAKDLVEFTQAEEEQEFTVNSSEASVNWTVAVSDSSWIKVSADDGATWGDITPATTGTKSYKVKVSKNEIGQPRMGKLVLSNGTPASDVELVVLQNYTASPIISSK